MGKLYVQTTVKDDSDFPISSRDHRLMLGSVPFHLPNIPRPQDVYDIHPNNSNAPFLHVFLEKSPDGSRYIHPIEKFSEWEFMAKDIRFVQPVEPLPMEETPYKLVEDVIELKLLADKLKLVDEFSVDLEHNKYRSFQGLTCLMKISTRIEDYAIDTLRLHDQIGLYLREVFKDPSKKKVMHGADNDILWLQRDFGIYVCNLFDTQQASNVLHLKGNNLGDLLSGFCGVTFDIYYEHTDWRLRPLPKNMLTNARVDTHYLLYIYDRMRCRLLPASTSARVPNDLLLVYKRSRNICVQLYEKELLTSESYIHTYGLHKADFNSQQLATLAGIFEWRDTVARKEDESTGYIMPNKTLLDIARRMPFTVSELKYNMKHPYVGVNLDVLLKIIKSSIKNSSCFESTAHSPKTGNQDKVTKHKMAVDHRILGESVESNENLQAGEMTTLLCIDGKGVRGIVPCVVLQFLESELQRYKQNSSIADFVDAIAGTSTGGLVATLLVTPNDQERPQYSVNDILDIYKIHSAKIFPSSGIPRMFKMVKGPRYDGIYLRSLIREKVGEKKMTDTLKELILPTYDMSLAKTRVFSTSEAKKNILLNPLLSDACISTSAAPIYFPPHSFSTVDLEGNTRNFVLVDGGVVANNPAMLAFLHLKKSPRNLRILSIGTGTCNLAGLFSYDEMSRWGILEWLYKKGVCPLIDTMFEASMDLVDSQLTALYDAEGVKTNYMRIQENNLPPHLALDGSSEDNMRELENVGKAILEKPIRVGSAVTVKQSLERLARELAIEQKQRSLRLQSEKIESEKKKRKISPPD